MSFKKSHKKIRIIQIKDIVSIILILTIFIVGISAVLGYSSTAKTSSVSTDLTSRDLAMFASISYADLEKISDYKVAVSNDVSKLKLTNNIMVTDNQLKSIISGTVLLGTNLSGETENTYKYLFYDLASTNEVKDWTLVNYFKKNTTIIKGTAEFTAMTFQKGNDIVIAYRGTDFDDLGDWIQDLKYGLIGYAGQEAITQQYALGIANEYAKNGQHPNIYVTGHSLGGYLAQIGGSALLQDVNFKNQVKKIGYFNGMGLFFWSNFSDTLPNSIKNSKMYKDLKDTSSNISKTQTKAKNTLEEWYRNGGDLVLYHINGDPVSALGKHCGNSVGSNAYSSCIIHHHGNQKNTNILQYSLFKAINKFLNYDISPYVEVYKPKELLDYVWITHETDSFFGVLTDAPNVNIKLPSKIKFNKLDNSGTITINTRNCKLQNSDLKVSDFTVSNKNRIAITNITKVSERPNNMNGYTYEYKITIKAKLLIGTTAYIALNENTLKTDNKLEEISNVRIASNMVKIVLK